MAKNDFNFVDEIANGYEKSQINQSILNEFMRLVTDRQKLTSELTETQLKKSILVNIAHNF